MLGLGGRKRKAVAFDVIGTVFPLEPLRSQLVRLGFAPSSLEGWFAAGLRDAFALAAAGDFKPFASVLEEALKSVAGEQELRTSSEDRASVIAGMKDLKPRPDAQAAFASLHEHGVEVLALTNGSPALTKHLLDQAGLRDLVAHVVSVDDVKLSKPRPEVYLHAARTAGVHLGELTLVAAHAWDINGAAAAGLSTAYLSADRPFNSAMRAPDVLAETLLEIVAALLKRA